MSHLSCKHCGKAVKADDQSCPSCGIPLPPDHAKERQNSFIIWFTVVVLFCLVMMVFLPPDWSPFVGK